MKSKSNQSMKCEGGITLIALIITVIILVILAAISIRAVYRSRMVDYAINGAIDYSLEMGKENEIMNGTENIINSTVKRIEDILGGKEPENSEPTPDTNNEPVFEGTPIVAKVANSNSSLTITAVATDPDGDNLTYTLCDPNGNAIEGVGTQTVPSGQGVTFTHSGLENYSTHTYKILVSDGGGNHTVYSDNGSGTTFCLGTYCPGSKEVTIENGKICPECNRCSPSLRRKLVLSHGGFT